MTNFNPLKETREWHSATDEAGCLKIEQRLQANGLRVSLTEIQRQQNSTSALPVVCIYEGADADPTAERFKPFSEQGD